MLLKTRLKALALGCLSATLSAAQPSFAQTGTPDSRQQFETRAQLEAQLKQAEADHNKNAAYLIHSRLDQGDFFVGDRIFVMVKQGATGFADTLVVRAGKLLDLPQLGQLSLAGALRSELEPRLTEQLGKYLRNPQVKAVPLVRLAILGGVGRPGFYYTPADLPLSDMLMIAGGPTPDANLEKVTVRRDGDIVIDEPNTATAIREGMSVDMLHLQAGDEIQVGRQQRSNWAMIIPFTGTAIGLIFTILRHR
jgi:hypothetical protein